MPEWVGHLWVQQLQGVLLLLFFKSWLIHRGLTCHAWEDGMTRTFTLFKASLNILGWRARQELASCKGMPRLGAEQLLGSSEDLSRCEDGVLAAIF